jgi:hypothetical protein
MQPSSAASSGFGYFYANHFYPELMNNGLIAELQIMRKIYSFHMGAGKEDTNTQVLNVIDLLLSISNSYDCREKH